MKNRIFLSFLPQGKNFHYLPQKWDSSGLHGHNPTCTKSDWRKIKIFNAIFNIQYIQLFNIIQKNFLIMIQLKKFFHKGPFTFRDRLLFANDPIVYAMYCIFTSKPYIIRYTFKLRSHIFSQNRILYDRKWR